MHTHERACWQSGLGNSLRTPWQPDTLPNTTLAHTHKHKHTQNSPFVGGGLSRAGTRDGRKVFCQAPLLNSQKGTQTQAGEAAAKRRSDGDTSYPLALGHMGGTHNLGDLCSVSLLRTAHDNIIHQTIVHTDSLCFIIQCSTCSLIPGFDMQSSLSLFQLFFFAFFRWGSADLSKLE